MVKNIDNNDIMPDKDAIDGSSIEEEGEGINSVSQPSKDMVEPEDTQTEPESVSDIENAVAEDESESSSEEDREEVTLSEVPDSEISEPVPSIDEVSDSEDTKVDHSDDPETPEAEDVEVSSEESDEVVVADDEDPEGEHKIDVGRAKWYAIRTFSGQEKKIRESLLANIHREKMEDKIFEILVPTENVVEMRDGKKRSRVKVFFPGYVLIQMDLDKESQFLVEETYGVLNFIGPSNNPQELRKKELKRIIGDTEESKGRDVMAAPYEVGDSIKVVDGPFNDFSGYVQEINEEKQKVKVMVSIFGRATPVELDFLQVAIEK